MHEERFELSAAEPNAWGMQQHGLPRPRSVGYSATVSGHTLYVLGGWNRGAEYDPCALYVDKLNLDTLRCRRKAFEQFGDRDLANNRTVLQCRANLPG